MTASSSLSIILSMISLASMARSASATSFVSEQMSLDVSRNLWQQQQIAGYRYTYDKIDQEDPQSYSYPWMIQVDNLRSTLQAQDNKLNSIYWDVPPSIDDLFDVIQSHIDNDAKQVHVKYDAKMGFPSSIYIIMNNGTVYDVENTAFVVTATPVSVRMQRSLKEAKQYSQEQEELNKAKALWQSKEVFDYYYIYNPHLADAEEANYPWAVHVQDAIPVKTTNSDNKQEATSTIPPTLDSFFQIIQNQIDSGAQKIEVQYNANFGFPQSISIITNSGEAYDVQVLGWTQDTQAAAQEKKSSNSLDDSKKYSQEQEDLDNAKALWQSKGIFDYYYIYYPQSLTSDEAAFAQAAYPWSIHVQDALPIQTLNSAEQEITFTIPPAMDSFFQTIQDAIDSDAQEIDVQYNDNFGFPETIKITTNSGDAYEIAVLGWKCNQGSPACDA